MKQKLNGMIGFFACLCFITSVDAMNDRGRSDAVVLDSLDKQIELFLVGTLDDIDRCYRAMGLVIARSVAEIEDSAGVWSTLAPGFVRKSLNLSDRNTESTQLFFDKMKSFHDKKEMADIAKQLYLLLENKTKTKSKDNLVIRGLVNFFLKNILLLIRKDFIEQEVMFSTHVKGESCFSRDCHACLLTKPEHKTVYGKEMELISLSCGHKICFACIEKDICDGKITCPECYKTVTVELLELPKSSPVDDNVPSGCNVCVVL
ncbi:hypothetical protein KKA53_04360 [Candidatus Dependentiae bacterium]|nr:hypothetical protein [Candidatus Dependentiae bacterium]